MKASRLIIANAPSLGKYFNAIFLSFSTYSFFCPHQRILLTRINLGMQHAGVTLLFYKNGNVIIFPYKFKYLDRYLYISLHKTFRAKIFAFYLINACSIPSHLHCNVTPLGTRIVKPKPNPTDPNLSQYLPNVALYQ